MNELQRTVFQVVGGLDTNGFIIETILAATALGILVSLINMAGARD